MNKPPFLDNEFHDDMMEIYRKTKVEIGYNATRFLQMVLNEGGLKTAKKLLANDEPSDGFTRLWENDRLDLSMENLVLKPKYRSLFTNQEIEIARERLKSFDFEFEDE